MKYVYKIAVLVCLSAIIVGFTNCGKPSTLVFENGNITKGGSSASSDPSVLAFEETVYPLTRANCIGCHQPDAATPTSPFHASDSVVQAHDELVNQAKINLMAPANSRIVKKIADGHNCWSDCSDNAAEMQAAITRWASLAGTSREPAGVSVVTGVVSLNSQTVAAELADAPNQQVTSGNINGKIIKIKINNLLGNLADKDYFFTVELYDYDRFSYQLKNPRIVVPDGNPIPRVFVRNIKIVINNVVRPEHPVWTTLERTTANATSTILTASSMLANKDKGNAEDVIGFNFQVIKIDNRTPDELSKDFFEKTLYKLTRANCSSCHAANVSPLHASLIVQQAHDAVLPGYVDFADPANSLIVRKIRNGHKEIDSVDLPLMMEQAIKEWGAGRAR